MNRLPVWSLALMGVACKGNAPAPELRATSAPSAVPADASTPPPAEAKDAGARAELPPSLLDVVPSSIAVSSIVSNPYDYAEHLIDGKLNTAWNSKTGDLVGAWIRFKVPADAKVRAIALTAGYTRTKGDLDLFTANHRIAKVEIRRDGTSLGTRSLDIESRALQSLPIDAAGGEFEIKVLETVAGSKKEWRELVVSELRVLGEPGSARRADNDPPRVGVGDYRLYPPERMPEPMANLFEEQTFADLAAVCAAWPEAAKKLQKQKPTDYAGQRITYGTPTCSEEKVVPTLANHATYKALKAVQLSDGYVSWVAPAVETARGITVLGYRYRENDPMDPGCPSTSRPVLLDKATVQNGWLVVTTGSERGAFCPQTENDPALAGFCVNLWQGAFFCKEASGKLICKHHEVQNQAPLAVKDAPAGDPLAKKGWWKTPWTEETKFVVQANGDLRLR